MSKANFAAQLQRGFDRIPVTRQILADLETPLTAYLKLADAPYTYLLESVQGGEKWGRYSILGLPAQRTISVYGQQVQLHEAGRLLSAEEVADPLAWITDYRATLNAAPGPGPMRFAGGLVGYFGYDTVRYIEPRLGPSPNPDPLGNPDILLMQSDELLVFDNLSGMLHLVVYCPASDAGYEQGCARLDELEQQLRAPLPARAATPVGAAVTEQDFESGFTQDGFEAAVRKAKEYIVDGDIMQVVLSQRLSIPYQADALDLYRALRHLNPSPYMFYLNLGDRHVVAASPEILVRQEQGEVTVRPIAGTRPRGANTVEDDALAEDLLADPKELAEHLMLIDLGRNDVGRIGQIGSVELTDKMIIERYSHVMHIVSNVVAKLADGCDSMDVLRATFPAGTVSGAPKVRAMEIIDELEPVKRGIYSGAVGYWDYSGNMDTAIAIRTAVIQEQQLHVQAGAGIVADSDPRSEWDETMNKARAIFRAVAMVQDGLQPVADND